MSQLGYIVVFCLLGGGASLLGGVGMLFWRKKLNRVIGELTSFAAGVLIAVAVLDLLPEAIEGGGILAVKWMVLLGILLLFLMEKTSLWFHHHHEPHGGMPNISGVWLGDTVHNFIDGLAIGVAFLISVEAGIATAVAVGMHELPQEMADFSLYLKAGFSSLKTILINLFSSLATVVGGVGVYFFGSVLEGVEYSLLAFTAGMFLYIALADLVPDLHQVRNRKQSLIQLIIFLMGIGLAYGSIGLLE